VQQATFSFPCRNALQLFSLKVGKNSLGKQNSLMNTSFDDSAISRMMNFSLK
jgi:hypothetical protein